MSRSALRAEPPCGVGFAGLFAGIAETRFPVGLLLPAKLRAAPLAWRPEGRLLPPPFLLAPGDTSVTAAWQTVRPEVAGGLSSSSSEASWLEGGASLWCEAEETTTRRDGEPHPSLQNDSRKRTAGGQRASRCSWRWLTQSRSVGLRTDSAAHRKTDARQSARRSAEKTPFSGDRRQVRRGGLSAVDRWAEAAPPPC